MIYVTQENGQEIKSVISYDLFSCYEKKKYLLANNTTAEISEENINSQYLRKLTFKLLKDTCFDSNITQLSQSVYRLKDIKKLKTFKWFFD
ncbi:MAG: hypothetical protein PHO61_04440, partial [Candidatus ainarchaeum sp.]|nr:hypothetical protein [Candidatus ainarchaeum sp.]